MAKASQVLANRQRQWSELSDLCAKLEKTPAGVSARERTHFALLYRSACADLALAEQYHLPPLTIRYLHTLVSRAHNQLYRSQQFQYQQWIRALMVDAPRQILHDRCVWTSAVLFWGLFGLAGFLAWHDGVWPGFAQSILSEQAIDQLEQSFAEPIQGNRFSPFMASFYIQHNTSIGLQCFVGGVLLIPGLAVEAFNAIFLGAAFGHMLRPDVAARDNFVTFVTAHGPFELTAIVVSAGAGLRIGWGWIQTHGWRRIVSLQRAAHQAMPIMGSAIVMFFLAALIESFISGTAFPYSVKLSVCFISTAILIFYFFVLGRASGSQP